MLDTLAADAINKFAVKGAGITTCESYTQERDQRSNKLYLYAGWMNGYISAYNQYQPKTFDIVPWQDTKLLIALLDSHCRKYPKQYFMRAVSAMLKQLEPRRIHQQSTLLMAKVDKQATQIYQEILERVQTRLAAQGLYNSKKRGDFNEATKIALKKYQIQENIPVTGLPDRTTLYVLFVRSEAKQEKMNN